MLFILPEEPLQIRVSKVHELDRTVSMLSVTFNSSSKPLVFGFPLSAKIWGANGEIFLVCSHTPHCSTRLHTTTCVVTCVSRIVGWPPKFRWACQSLCNLAIIFKGSLHRVSISFSSQPIALSKFIIPQKRQTNTRWYKYDQVSGFFQVLWL